MTRYRLIAAGSLNGSRLVVQRGWTFLLLPFRRPIGLYFRAETAEGVEYMVSDSVGKTQYNVQDLKDIGQLLISYFGSYHLVFWNCQHFANAYLSIICDGQYRPVLTTSDVLRGTMFCTMVGAPLATTHKLAEDTRRTKLVGYVEDDLRQSDDLISELLPSGPVYRSPANCIVL
ncbi:uncharacterized protein EV422DRAFT_211464 [Fimicolochytrium jonesii]|uniref:uncharacterized protein n=1 Tax=Fimicolochytrium jonesii TaxID=1396493 RepID=UPI0022FE99E4|nr:uncharacterized protein EV422DRAFT_211464 [Fimicolochytrium jonesii]KAI8817671.1 hypothetical protein EV422DRAFT_211464 [Fimicolochytrium jonesii]